MHEAIAPLLVSLAVLSSPVAAQPAPPSSPADDFVAGTPVEPLTGPAAAALSAIRAQALAAHVAFLASPALEGRGLGTPGLDAAVEYAASALALAGIPPLAADQAAPERARWFQTVPLRSIRGLAGEVTVERSDGSQSRTRAFLSGVDCVFPEVAPQVVHAPVVFASFGIREPKAGRDDYRGLDVRGKVVLVLDGLPPGPEWQTEEMRSRYGADGARPHVSARLDAARSLGAAAVLLVERDFAALATEDRPAERFFLPFDAPRRMEPLLVRVSPAAGDAILEGAVSSAESARAAGPRLLAGVTVTIRVAGEERLIPSRNVVGVLAGSDTGLRGEAVVIGAHLDHLGKSDAAIYPGADDDASGVAALIEIAKAFAAAEKRPKRTLVFAFWTGEEEGKLGSGYWVRHPLWPLGQTTAYLNLDMIGHPWSAEEIAKLVNESCLPDGAAFLSRIKPADFAEPGLPPDAPAIAAALRRAAHATGMALHLDRTDGTSGGSDYRDFARAHVPFVRFFGNFFPGYHEAGDTAESLDAAQVERVARLAFATAWLLADR